MKFFTNYFYFVNIQNFQKKNQSFESFHTNYCDYLHLAFDLNTISHFFKLYSNHNNLFH
jgi:hypothetical protein